MAIFEELAKWLRGKKPQQTQPPNDDNLETEQQYKERWRSIYIIYFTMFLISLGFSIIVTGVWPYLDKLDPTAGKEFMGYIVAANPLGQMLFSPLVGWWSNKLGSIRIPVMLSLIVFTISSVLYSSLELFETNRKWWMLWTRFFVGVSSANIAACRSYLSAATRFSERTKAVSMISLAQVLGFVFGPAIQAAVVPLGDEGIWIIENKLHLNMYTAAGWINVILSLLNVYLFVPSVFKEYRIAAREAMLKQGKDNEKDTWKQHKPDYFAAWTLLVAFFVIVFNFMLLETLGTPVTMDQFGWTKAESLKYMGILMSLGAFLAIITFAAINPLSRIFSEVKIMIWGGFLLMVIGRVLYIPWGDTTPPIYDEELKLNLTIKCNNYKTELINNNLTFSSENTYYLYQKIKTVTKENITNFITQINATNPDELNSTLFDALDVCNTELLGCPSTQKWCSYTPAMTVTQFMLGYVLTVFGYPVGVTLIQTIFSKILGPRPQGVWMGLMTGSGCLSRVMGPVFVTYIYAEFGTIVTFGFTTLMMAGCLIWLLYFNDKLVPKEVCAGDSDEEGEELKNVNSFVSVDLNEPKVTDALKGEDGYS